MELLMGNTKRPQSRSSVSTKQQQIAQTACRYRGEALTTLNHYLDLEWLTEAYRKLRAKSAPGVDKVSHATYGENLEERLSQLLDRAKSGNYRALPVKRVEIPKGMSGKETRPIGIPTTEDKVLQRAVVMILEPIFEQSFYDFSFGFRPGRSQHQALDYLWKQIMDNNTRWILDVDVRKYFDNIDKAKLREMVSQRVRDGVLTRLVGKWLKAGVLHEGSIHYTETGTPQGGVISPLLSNIYLHVVLDWWFSTKVRPRLKGRAFVVRFADDSALGFEYKSDAERVLAMLHERFEEYGLALHPVKTKLIPFGRPGRAGDDHGPMPGTFDFLGFTHYWGRSRRGRWVVKRKTASSRFSRSLKQVDEWCRINRHQPMRNQFVTLALKLKGHCAYYGITGNGRMLERYREECKKIWFKWLNRRSRRRQDMSWERYGVLMREHFVLPPAKVVHSVYAAKP